MQSYSSKKGSKRNRGYYPSKNVDRSYRQMFKKIREMLMESQQEVFVVGV